MRFFVPHVSAAKTTDTYDNIVKSVKDQLRVTIATRKIFSISYVHDKKMLKAQVGKPDPQSGRYEVVAILEAKPYIVFTRGNDGGPGLNLLVSHDEITEVIDFD
jgi:hypothetical protein